MKTMQDNGKVLVGLAAAAAVLRVGLHVMAGDLEPSAPPWLTMKTLDEVEPRISISRIGLPLNIAESSSC